MNVWMFATFAIGLSVAAQFLLKAGMSGPAVRSSLETSDYVGWGLVVFTQPLVLTGLVTYALGSVVWLGVLSRLDVTKAYPLVGMGFVLTALVGWLMGESLSASRILGIFFICMGVILVGRS